MAFANVTYTGDGSSTEYTIPFSYLNQSFVVVTLDDVVKTLSTDYTINNTTSKVTFTTPPDNLAVINVYRSTANTEAGLVVNFSDGSGLTAADLNNSSKQLLHIIQEALDNQSTFNEIALIDDDTLATASAVSVATSESIKAYTDNTTGMGNVLEDTTPQLGGDLDTNGNDIITTSNADINLTPNGTGKVHVGTKLEVDDLLLDGNSLTSITTDSDIIVQPDGTGGILLKGDVDLDSALRVNSNHITSLATNADINLTPNGTGTVVVGGDLDVDNINIDGNTIRSTDTNGDINLTPNGTGTIVLDGKDWINTAGSTGQVARLDGSLNWELYTPATGGMGNIVEDATPQLGGDLDLNGNQITSPDGTDLIDIPNGSIDIQTASSSRMDVTDSGVRLGGANARVTTILDEDTMGSDSATSLATQQSIKAYVDSFSSGWIPLATATASSTATIDFSLTGSYEHYVVVMDHIIPATDGADMYLRVSDDGGSTFETTNYAYSCSEAINSTHQFSDSGSGSTGTEIKLNVAAGSVGNVTGENCSGIVHILTNATGHPHVFGRLGGRRSDGFIFNSTVYGTWSTATAITGIQFLASSGNISTGHYTLYGLARS